MSFSFEEWVYLLRDDRDPGHFGPGVWDWLHEVFDAHGPIDDAELAVLGKLREIEVAQHAIALVAADIHATTPWPELTIEAARGDDGELGVSFGGSFEALPPLALRAPESIYEIAGALQVRVMDDGMTVWPVCATHDRGLHPRLADGTAVWRCDAGGHTVAEIGQLGVSSRLSRAPRRPRPGER